jgi:FixJ family two-component response regulator
LGIGVQAAYRLNRLFYTRGISVAFDGFLLFPDRTGIINDMSGETIFIVDDDEAVRDSLKLLLESHGCRVQDYGSTRDFFRDYRKGERQCVVLDHHLPGETGVEFLESDDGSNLQVPVIMVTGGGDQALKARATKAGALAYFDKPINDSDLVATIFRLLGDAPSAA